MTAFAQEGISSSRYEVLGRLAGGGMAEIFLARATTVANVERHVVLKRIRADHGRGDLVRPGGAVDAPARAHLPVSATAMAKFMREQFGVRHEP